MKLFLLSGGRHPYDESTPVLADCLRGAGHEVTVSEDPAPLADADALAGYDAIVFNSRRENLPDFGDLLLSGGERDGLAGAIRDGKGFLCLHISTARPKEWPEYHEITGGGWITGESFHPPYGEFHVAVTNPDHAITRGVADFDTVDELYMGLAVLEGNDVFLSADAEAGTWPWGPAREPTHMPAGTFPLGWTRMYGQGRVCTLLLGHDAASFSTPGFQQMILNGVAWCADV